eukprot:gene39061-62684_t
MRVNPREAEVLCELDPEYRDYLTKGGTIYVRLLKALYGCVQSAKLWFDRF